MNPASAPLLADARPATGEHVTADPHDPAVRERWPVAVLGVPFDPVTIDEAISRIDAMIASRKSHYVVTANVDFLVQAHRDVELRRILIDADLVLCDGTPVLWASRWLGNPLPERVAGSDLVPALIAAAAGKGQRLFFLGAAPGVAAEAEAKLKQAYPALNVVGTYAPPFSHLLEMDHAEIARRIRAARPDILLVSFGCPKQEKWIAMHHRALGVPVAIGVGATLDFLAGRVKRAPGWMRRTGTEWLYRLLQEPRRLYRRYAADLVQFVPVLLAQWWRLTTRGRARGLPRELKSVPPGWRKIDAGNQLTRHSLERDGRFWCGVRARQGHCLVDLSQIRGVDGTGVAFLIRCRKEFHAQGRRFVLLSPSAALRGVLASLRLSDHFTTADDPADATRGAEAPVASTPACEGTMRTLAWCGEVIAANTDDVWQMTTDHIRAFAGAQATLVIIDLTRLRFIDSSGAALMLRLKKWAQSLGVQILFAHAQRNVRNVLQLTRLDQLILEGAQ